MRGAYYGYEMRALAPSTVEILHLDASCNHVHVKHVTHVHVHIVQPHTLLATHPHVAVNLSPLQVPVEVLTSTKVSRGLSSKSLRGLVCAFGFLLLSPRVRLATLVHPTRHGQAEVT